MESISLTRSTLFGIKEILFNEVPKYEVVKVYELSDKVTVLLLNKITGKLSKEEIKC